MNFDFLHEFTERFTGGDLTELCQGATKPAIRVSIETDEQFKALMKENHDGDQAMAEAMEDRVPVITREHIEEALAATDFPKF